MLLNKKQKKYLFTAILSKKDLFKLFETDDLNWLCSQKVKIGEENNYGWRPLIVDKETVTNLNFATYPGWLEILTNIDNYDQCQWCEDWFEKEELNYKKDGLTCLCDHCKDYLISREGEC